MDENYGTVGRHGRLPGMPQILPQGIETVFIKRRDGGTVCVSTQVGCPVGCIFCEDVYKRQLIRSRRMPTGISVVRRNTKSHRRKSFATTMRLAAKYGSAAGTS